MPNPIHEAFIPDEYIKRWITSTFPKSRMEPSAYHERDHKINITRHVHDDFNIASNDVVEAYRGCENGDSQSQTQCIDLNLASRRMTEYRYEKPGRRHYDPFIEKLEKQCGRQRAYHTGRYTPEASESWKDHRSSRNSTGLPSIGCNSPRKKQNADGGAGGDENKLRDAGEADPSQKYERRKRCRTKSDKYEYKGYEEQQKHNQDGETSSKRRCKTGRSAESHDFKAPNAYTQRVSLPVYRKPSILAQNNALKSIEGRDIPDLTFCDMSLLLNKVKNHKTILPKVIDTDTRNLDKDQKASYVSDSVSHKCYAESNVDHNILHTSAATSVPSEHLIVHPKKRRLLFTSSSAKAQQILHEVFPTDTRPPFSDENTDHTKDNDMPMRKHSRHAYVHPHTDKSGEALHPILLVGEVFYRGGSPERHLQPHCYGYNAKLLKNVCLKEENDEGPLLRTGAESLMNHNLLNACARLSSPSRRLASADQSIDITRMKPHYTLEDLKELSSFADLEVDPSNHLSCAERPDDPDPISRPHDSIKPRTTSPYGRHQGPGYSDPSCPITEFTDLDLPLSRDKFTPLMRHSTLRHAVFSNENISNVGKKCTHSTGTPECVHATRKRQENETADHLDRAYGNRPVPAIRIRSVHSDEYSNYAIANGDHNPASTYLNSDSLPFPQHLEKRKSMSISDNASNMMLEQRYIPPQLDQFDIAVLLDHQSPSFEGRKNMQGSGDLCDTALKFNDHKGSFLEAHTWITEQFLKSWGSGIQAQPCLEIQNFDEESSNAAFDGQLLKRPALQTQLDVGYPLAFSKPNDLN